VRNVPIAVATIDHDELLFAWPRQDLIVRRGRCSDVRPVDRRQPAQPQSVGHWPSYITSMTSMDLAA
jgi:hypothetical protein